jgi:hypothetical protein
VVFDADQRAKPDFFLKVLEVMYDDDVSLCLTPQVRLCPACLHACICMSKRVP